MLVVHPLDPGMLRLDLTLIPLALTDRWAHTTGCARLRAAGCCARALRSGRWLMNDSWRIAGGVLGSGVWPLAATACRLLAW